MKLAPSVLAADLAELGSAIEICEAGGADLVHVDVMDGHFVPNLTFGAPVVEALARRTDLPLDVHLMVSNPERLLDDYLEAGASWISVHVEAASHLDRLVDRIQAAGARAGTALNPATPLSAVDEIVERIDFVLLMSVNPGFAGQSFIRYVLDKTRRLRRLVEQRDLEVEIEVDGGVSTETIGAVVKSGADVCVAGSAIFGSDDPVERMHELRQRARAA